MYLAITIILGVLYSNPLEYNYESLSNDRQEGLSTLQDYSLSSQDIYLEETVDPKSYFVGPGDIFLFNMISTDGMHTLNLVVSPLGTVLIPNVGDISVDKMLLSDAFAKIKDTCLKSYSNAKVNLTLKGIRKYKIQVVGPVYQPGSVLANPFMRISDIYNEVNNIDDLDNQINHFNSNNDISLRNIILKRNDKEYKVDLFKYFYGGDKTSNPFVEQGDVLYFSKKKSEITIKGGIGLPGTYEFVNDESIYGLIELVGGFTDNADTNYVQISRFKDDINKEIFVISDIDELKIFKLRAYDYIHVRYKKDFKRRELISVSGEVHYPGEYNLNVSLTVGQLLDIAGGYTDKADINRIIINNEQIINNTDNEYERILLIPVKDRTITEISYVKSRNKIKKGLIVSEDFNRTEEILLYNVQAGDLVYIPKKSNYIEILGSVKFPGRYPYDENLSVSAYIESAGGKTNNATRKIYIIDNASNQRNRAKNSDRLENGDVLFIQSKEDYSPYNRFKDVMAIIGQAASLYAVIMLNK